MGSTIQRPPIWLLPRPVGSLPTLGGGHPTLALAVAVAGLVALVPAFAFLAPPSHWDKQVELVVLLLFSFYAYVGAAHLRGTASLDAACVGALLGVVLLGPLAGAFIFAAPELTSLATDRRLTSTLANLASFGWATLAAAWILDPLGRMVIADVGSAGSYVAVGVAGLVLLLVNYFYITIISDRIKDGNGLVFATRRELIPTLPVVVPMLVAAAAIVFLYEQFGVVGFLPLAGVVFIPRLLVPVMLRDIPVAELSVSEATARYAGGLADVLGLSGAQRRVLCDGATHLGDHATLTRLEDFHTVMRTVLFSHERWDGDGRLGLVAGERIPIESRVLAVARAWAALTAGGTARLTPAEALVNLRARAGEDLDPTVVAAAVKIVAEEVIDLGTADTRPPPETAIAA